MTIQIVDWSFTKTVPVTPNQNGGLYVANGILNNPDGTEFRIRGMNRLFISNNPWTGTNGPTNGALVKPAAVRIFFFSDPASFLSSMQSDHINNKEIVIPCINYIDGVYTSGDDNTADLTACVNHWVSIAPTWAPIMNKYGIINIANEFFNTGSQATWISNYITAVQTLRQYYTCPFLVDAGGYGQAYNYIINGASQILAADSAKNVLFGYHAYNSATPSNVDSLFSSLAALRSQGVCVVIAEFGPGNNVGPSPTLLTPQTVVSTAEKYGLGWMPWCWDSSDGFQLTTNGGYYTGTSSQLTAYGQIMVPLIQQYSVKSTIFS